MKKNNVFLVLLTGLALTLGIAGCPTEPDGGKKQEKVAAPTANPPANAVAASTLITLSCETEGAVIFYNLAGTDPSRSDTLYDESSKPEITSGCTLKALRSKTA